MGRDSVVGVTTRYRLDGAGSYPDGDETFRTRPERPWGPPSLLYNEYRFSFPGVKHSGVALTIHPHSAPKLRNEKNCASTPSLGFHGML
jgi:hypothetical protein